MWRYTSCFVLLAVSCQVQATGFDEDACRSKVLTADQVKRLDAEVHTATGLHLEPGKPVACRHAGYVKVYASTQRQAEPDGSERWYEASCEYPRAVSMRMDCRYTGQRVLRVRRDGWPDGEARIFIPLSADGAWIRKRLDEALPLADGLGEANACESGEQASHQLLELRSDLAYPSSGLQVAIEGDRFTFWTLRYAIHFTFDSAESSLKLRCWRPKKSPGECLTSSCPA